ncbi:hypothetical protein [Metallosphaera hakonensis]|uniref:hypothetical protein n=1 Tax=Metallosphaera hakonensis TaxID=79601 RepID=UPI001F0D10E5|nr:hypothetical protein [Metallosphaera hakonensis]
MEDEARNNGFVLLSDYIKFKLLGNTSITSLQQGSKDLNESMDSITNELLSVKKKLGELSERVETIESALINRQTIQPSGTEPKREKKEEKRPVQEQRRSAMDYLREQGVMYESKMSNLKNPDALFDKLESQGAKIIWTAEERIAMDPTFYNNFIAKLAQIHTPDETEAQKHLSRQEHELFQRLRKTGSIYFDNQDKYWKLTS